MLSVLTRKTLTMKFTEVIEIRKPRYITLRIKPHKSIRNYASAEIARAITKMYEKITQRIMFEEKKLIYKSTMSCTYFIDIKKDDVRFNFIVPERYKALAMDKIRDVWSRATIEEVDRVDPFTEEAIKYQLFYKKEDALSLEIDKTNNSPLNSILNVLEDMEDEDRVGVFYNFQAVTNQRNWKYSYEKTMKKLKEGEPVDKAFTGKKILKVTGEVFNFVLDIAMYVALSFFGSSEKKKEDVSKNILSSFMLHEQIKPSNATKNKRELPVVKTNIAVFSDSKDPHRRRHNAEAVAGAFSSINSDNTLDYQKLKKATIDPDNMNIKGKKVKYNMFSIDECSNLLQLPGKTLLDQYKIDCIETLETIVNAELLKGYVRLGINTYKGQEVETYMSDAGEQGNLGLAVMGPQGSGKTVFLTNYVLDVAGRGESAIVMDYIRNNNLTKRIEKAVKEKYGEDKLFIIDLADPKQAQAFGFNEVWNREHKDTEELLEIANMQTQKMIAFINAINPDAELSTRMRRSLAAACNVVFIQPGTSMRDVIDCCVDYRKRAEFIKNIPPELINELHDDIYNLRDMDQYGSLKQDKDTVVDTKEKKIEFILDRINILMEDIKLKRMFNKPIEQNVDFMELMNQGKIILIRAPESVFTENEQKNILTTFYLSKAWLCRQLGATDTRCHFIVDEIFQCDTAAKLLKDLLPKGRQFKFKIVLSLHYLNQVEVIREAMKASGASYMLLQGTDEKNYKELESYLLPYTVDDLLNLKQFHSLNLVKCTQGYSTFITKLPGEPEGTQDFKDLEE